MFGVSGPYSEILFSKSLRTGKKYVDTASLLTFCSLKLLLRQNLFTSLNLELKSCAFTWLDLWNATNMISY